MRKEDSGVVMSQPCADAGPDSPRSPDPLAVLEQAAKICEQAAADFLSPEYARGQPLSSFSERFACSECARAIRDYAERVALVPQKEGC